MCWNKNVVTVGEEISFQFQQNLWLADIFDEENFEYMIVKK